MPTYVIIRSNRGLGLKFVRQLSFSPSKTIFASVRSPTADLSALCSYQSSADTKIHILECNTASLASIESFTKTVSTTIGQVSKVDCLVNNAGINSAPEEGAFNITYKSLGDHISVNVLGLAKGVEGLRTHLEEGSVVMNMTSGLGSYAVGRERCKA